MFVLDAVNLSEHEMIRTVHSIDSDTDCRMRQIGADDGLQGDHDSALSTLAELAARRVLACGEAEAESCRICS